MNTPTSILSLPSEVTHLMASFLLTSNALHLAETCKTLQSKLLLCLLPNSHVLLTSKAWSGHRHWGHKDTPFVQIPCLSPHVYLIILTFQWHDQGWGHSSSGLWVISQKKNTLPNPFQSFYSGQVVWTFGACTKTEGTMPGDVFHVSR